jgi:hypothetical protein
LSVSRSRWETSFQSRSAVGSSACSTEGLAASCSGVAGARAYHPVGAPSATRTSVDPTEKSVCFQGFLVSPHDSPQLWKPTCLASVRATRNAREQPFRERTPLARLWITGGVRASSILRAPLRSKGRGPVNSKVPLCREAHLPAERPPPQA